MVSHPGGRYEGKHHDLVAIVSEIVILGAADYKADLLIEPCTIGRPYS